MSENSEAEINKIIELNDLVEEMLGDARKISRDLTEGITNTGVTALLAMIISLIQLLILRENFWRGPIFIGIWAIGFIAIFVNGVRSIQKYLKLKNRYARFFEINKELEKM